MMVAAFYLLPCLFILSASKPSDDSTGVTAVSEPTLTEQDPTTQLSDIQDEQDTTESRKRFDEAYKHIQNLASYIDRNEYEYLNPWNRYRRSETGLKSFFKSLFVQPTNISEDSEVRPLSNIRTTNITENNADDVNTNIIDTGKDERSEHTNMLYKLNETLEKLVKALSILAERTNLKIAVVDIPLRRLKRDVTMLPNVSDILNVTSGNVTKNTDISGNVTKNTDTSENVTKNTDTSGNVTKLRDDNERETDLGNVTSPNSVVNATGLQDSNPVDNTRSLRVDNVTESQETNDIAVTNRSINDNVTNTSNINVTYRNTRRSFVNEQSDETIKSALEHIQQHILNIKNHKIVSDESFKMGYIVSSLETLEQTLKKIMNRIAFDGNDEWARKITVKIEMSKKVVSNLMEYLRLHTDNVKWE